MTDKNVDIVGLTPVCRWAATFWKKNAYWLFSLLVKFWIAYLPSIASYDLW
jgi:hypothetical protein